MVISPQGGYCSTYYCRTALRDKIEKSLLPLFCTIKNSEEFIDHTLEKYDRKEIMKSSVPATINEKEALEVVRGENVC